MILFAVVKSASKKKRRLSFLPCHVSAPIFVKVLVSHIGYRISAAYQNMGFVTEALRRVIRFCFEETGIQRLEAEVMTVNVASNRVMEKCGFTCEGTKRQAKFVNIYTDFNIYGLLRSDIMGERAAST